ncbi:hypothetical protein C8J57DRAFT_1715378 [Mycena rebaudengoi]|nr:hypothetical protein C8J57DRAFT_1715378 [Mycena rebaudengoi]
MDGIDTPAEKALRAHIRQLLLSYYINNITTDYLQFTAEAVTDIWCQYFVEIPTTDPNSLLLPTDPFDTLTRINGLDSIESFQEKFRSTPNAIQVELKLSFAVQWLDVPQHLKNTIKPKLSKPRSERVSLEESTFESYVPVCRPMSPILTTRAIRETPRLGTHKFLKSLPPLYADFISSQEIKTVEVETMLEPSVKTDEVLNTNWRLRPEEHEPVRSLLRAVLAPRIGPGYKNRHLDFAARPNSPSIPDQLPAPPFIPIFPRSAKRGGGIRHDAPAPLGLKNIANLPALILPPVKVEQLEPDLHTQNMVVVDGWQAYKSSPSPTPTPSPASTQEDQIDELFMSSPDTTPPPARATKMDVVQIPRNRRIGGARKKPAPVGYGKDLGTFLAPHVRKTQVAKPDCSLSSVAATSMLGQPSACDGPQPTVAMDEDGLDSDIGQLYGSLQQQDSRDLILKVKVDEKQQLLMEVPDMPPPNEHPHNALFLPLTLRHLVFQSKPEGQPSIKNPTHRFLRKVKGISSLNVALGWFPGGHTEVPTHAQICKVTSLLDATMSSSSNQLQIAILLAPVTISIPDIPNEDFWNPLYGNLDPGFASEDASIARCEIILSRKERRRLAGIPDEIEALVQDSDSDEMEVEEHPHEESRPTKRRRSAPDEHLNDSGISFDVMDFDQNQDTNTAFYDDTPLDADKENLPLAFYHQYGDQDFELDYDDPEQYRQPQGRLDFSLPPSSGMMDSSSQLDGELQYEYREFEPLSFESRQVPSARPSQLPAENVISGDATVDDPHSDAVENNPAIEKPPPPRRTLPDIATHSLGIAEFAKLRAKKVYVPEPPPIVAPTHVAPVEDPSHHSVPDTVYDRSTIRLPPTWDSPSTVHRYMVSMELVQKQALVRSLRSPTCLVNLVERDSMFGADIILDPHSAVIFTNLLVLPSECTNLATRIEQQSWCYSRLLVVFEAYPASHSYQAKASKNELFAYSPPIVKALGKLRRNIGISEGCGTKRRDCEVAYVFADTVDEAAMFTRHFGDFAEANNESRGILWGDREWLEDDVPEGEQELAQADGMNLFAAFVILCQMDLEDFLDLEPQARIEKFADFVGLERIMVLNQVIQNRLETMQPSDTTMETDQGLDVEQEDGSRH